MVPGDELKMCGLVARVARAALEEAYVPRCQLPLKIRGEWILGEPVLFPGYVMLRTRDLRGLRRSLSVLTEYNRLLSTDGGFVPLSTNELQVIDTICGAERLLAVSEGVVRTGVLTVTRGPLVGKECLIEKYDRHKRCAYLTAGVLGRARVRVGLEIPVST